MFKPTIGRRGKTNRGFSYVDLIKRTLTWAHLWTGHAIWDASLLLSSPGCTQQRWHLDYAVHRYVRKRMPYACLLTLENVDRSKLHVFHGKCREGSLQRPEVLYVISCLFLACFLSCFLFASCLVAYWLGCVLALIAYQR